MYIESSPFPFQIPPIESPVTPTVNWYSINIELIQNEMFIIFWSLIKSLASKFLYTSKNSKIYLSSILAPQITAIGFTKLTISDIMPTAKNNIKTLGTHFPSIIFISGVLLLINPFLKKKRLKMIISGSI